MTVYSGVFCIGVLVGGFGGGVVRFVQAIAVHGDELSCEMPLAAAFDVEIADDAEDDGAYAVEHHILHGIGKTDVKKAVPCKNIRSNRYTAYRIECRYNKLSTEFIPCQSNNRNIQY